MSNAGLLRIRTNVSSRAFKSRDPSTSVGMTILIRLPRRSHLAAGNDGQIIIHALHQPSTTHAAFRLNL